MKVGNGSDVMVKDEGFCSCEGGTSADTRCDRMKPLSRQPVIANVPTVLTCCSEAGR